MRQLARARLVRSSDAPDDHGQKTFVATDDDSRHDNAGSGKAASEYCQILQIDDELFSVEVLERPWQDGWIAPNSWPVRSRRSR